MKISVITVCLNAQETIEETLLSILNQSYKNIELIVIDGGSTDSTLEIINQYKDKITYLVSEPDNGIYDAMNKGIKIATGDFIYFLNADDSLYNNQVLEKVVSVISKTSGVKILFGDANYVLKNKQKTVNFKNIKNNFSLIFNNICHQSIFYHKSLFDELGGFSNEFKIYADWDFNINSLVKNKESAIYLATPIANFRLGGACSSKANKKLCDFEKKLLIEKYYDKSKHIIFLHDFLRKYFSKAYKFFKKFFDRLLAEDSFDLNL